MSDGRAPHRWSASVGLAFAILFLVGYVFASGTPGADASRADRLAFSQGDADAVRVFVGAYLLVIAGLMFVWFAAILRRRFDRGGDGPAWSVAAGCALLYAAMLFAVSALQATVAVNVLFAENDPELGPSTVRALEIVSGLLLLIGGGLAAAVFIVLVSRLGRSAGGLPAWLSLAGYVAAALVALSFLYLPALSLYLWAAVVSIYLVTHPGAPRPAEA